MQTFTSLFKCRCVSALLVGATYAATPTAETFFLGSPVAMDMPAAMVQRLTPLATYLNQQSQQLDQGYDGFLVSGRLKTTTQ